jgi:hypothetical protein
VAQRSAAEILGAANKQRAAAVAVEMAAIRDMRMEFISRKQVADNGNKGIAFWCRSIRTSVTSLVLSVNGVEVSF